MFGCALVVKRTLYFSQAEAPQAEIYSLTTKTKSPSTLHKTDELEPINIQSLKKHNSWKTITSILKPLKAAHAKLTCMETMVEKVKEAR